MRVFSQPLLAILFGGFILCAETCLHLEGILNSSQWIDLPIHDWMAGASLVVSGMIGRRDWSKGRIYQAAAWGFMCSLLVGAFVGHWEEWSLQPQGDGWISDSAFVSILAALLVLSVCGLAGTLARQR